MSFDEIEVDIRVPLKEIESACLLSILMLKGQENSAAHIDGTLS